MPRKLTKKELGQLQLSTGWTEEELNDPAVLAIRRQLEEQAGQREQLARSPFSNVEGAVDTVPAVPEQAETGGLSALLASLDESVARNRQAHRDALVGGGKRSLGAAMQAAEEHGAGGVASILDALYEQFNLEGGGTIGYALRTAQNPDQPSLAEKGAGLFREGSQQVTQAYDASQRNTSGFGRQLSGAAVDALSSPSSAASLTGIPGVVGLAGLDTYAQEYASARGEGLPQASADKRAVGQGGIELLFESLPTGKIAERILPAEARRRLMGDARKVALETLASMGVEGLGEAATGAGQMLFDKAIAETTDDKQLAKFASDQLPKDAAGVAEALWRNARAGSAMAGAVAGPTAALDAAFDRARTASELIGAANKAILERDGRTGDVKPTNAITPTAPPPVQGELFAPGTGTFEQAQAERQKTLETDAGITVGRKKAAIEEGRAARLEGILSELDQARQQQEPLQEKVETLGPRASEQDLSSLAAVNRRVRALEAEYQQVQAQQETARTAEAPKPVTAPVAPAQQQDLFAEQEAAELRKQKTAELLKRNEAKKLIATDTKGIQASAKSSRAAARRKFLAELSISTRSLPEDQRVDAITQATSQWDNANPLSAFVAAASQPKAAGKAKPKKSKKVDTAPTDEVDTTTTPADLLKRFDGLSQESLDSPESPAPKNSGSIEHVFRAMLKKVGKGDVKVLNKMMQDGNIKVVEDTSFLPQASSENTKGHYDGKTLYIVAGNLNADNIIGDMLSVAAHETKHAADLSDGDKAVKSSLRALVGDEANKRLVSKIEALATKDREVGALVNALKRHYPNRKVYNLELGAHFLNHALDKRDNTFLVKRVMDDAVSAVMVGAKKKLGINDVNLKDVAYLARQLVTEAAVAGERLTTENIKAKISDDGLQMIGGASAPGFMPAARDGRVYIGKVDGLPRFEFSDHESTIDNGAFDILKRVSTKQQGIPLGSLLNHPELYRQYPELQDYTVTIDNSIDKVSSDASGYFSGNGKNLLAISPKVAKNVEETRSILLHEVQHAIQEIEGHDPGASPKQFQNPTIKAAYNSALAEYTNMLDEITLNAGVVNTLPPEAKADYQKELRNSRYKTVSNAKDLFYSKYASKSSDMGERNLGEDYREVKAKFDKATKAWDDERTRARNEYLRVYGEAEARATQLRRNLTPEEREILSPEGDMRYAYGKVPVEKTTRSPKARRTIEESTDDDGVPKAVGTKNSVQETASGMRQLPKGTRVRFTKTEAEGDNTVTSEYIGTVTRSRLVTKGQVEPFFAHSVSYTKNGETHHTMLIPQSITEVLRGPRGLVQNADSPEGLDQTVFHGTPHQVKNFSLQKVGTGEGNQAFGWGLYFASERSIADYYRKTLARDRMDNDAELQRYWNDLVARLRDEDLLGFDSAGEAASALRAEPDAWELADRTGVMDALRNYDARKKALQGNLYKVHIPEDEDLLDWDAPLSQQPPKVRAALESMFSGLDEPRHQAKTGRHIYMNIVEHFTEAKGIRGKAKLILYGNREADPAAWREASEALREAGIPGLRYLDGNSRRSGEGKYNYVIWDEELISAPQDADGPEGLDFLPRKYTVGNTAAKEALRVAERLLWSGGFTNSVLKEITLHASHLPASLMVKATKYGNDMLNAIDHNAAAAGKGKSADEQRKIRQRLRVDLGKEIERIDQLPTKAERDSALDALDRSERFRGIGQAVRAIRDFKMELTRELFELRRRDPKPLTQKETAVYTKMIENAERYTTRAYLATYNDKIGIKYGKNLWKRFERDPDSLEGRIVQRALDYLMSRELIIPDTESLHKLGTAQLRRMHENWIGGTSSFKGEKGRNQMIRALSRLPEHTQEEINAKAVEIVKDMLNLNKNKGISARFYSIGAKQNRTILEARSDIPPELRALMGEITDPFLREAISLQRMINLSAKTKLLTEVFEAGASRGWWSDIKTDEHETQLNDIAYGPMNGKWINRDLEDALTGTVMSLESTDKMIADAIHNPTAFSQFLAGKSVRLLTSLSRVQKTYRIVYSLAQMVFNGVGAFANIALNGIVNPKTMARGMHDAFLVLSSEINSKILNERNLPTVQEIVRAGVIDSATVGEFKSQAYENITEQIKKLDPDQPGYTQKVMHVLWNFVSAQGDLANAVRQVYAFMDIWTKVATYHDRKQFLTKFSEAEGLNWSEETIQRRAGYEASGTNISYERAFPLAKIIEKNLPFGMFLTYFAEVPRTIGTSYLQVLADANLARNAKTEEGRKLATTKAILRFAGTNAAMMGVVAATLNALSNDDEEEKKRRRLDPEWMQNKFTLPIGVDSEGNTVLFEVNRFDPNGPLNEAIVSVLSSPPEERAEALYNQVVGLFVPAQGAIAVYRILHDMVIEAGARATGNASLYEKDMRSKRTVLERNYPEQFAKLRHLLGYGDLGENTVAAVEALWLPASVQPLVDQKGKVVEVRPEDVDMENVPQALGYRPYVRNPDLSLEFRVKDYNNEMKAIMRDRGKLLRDAHQLDESTIVRELGDMVAREKEAFDKLRYNFEGYMAYEDKTLKDAATHFDSNKLFAQIRYNKFRPRVVSQESLRDWAKGQIKEGRDRQEVKEVYTLLQRLYTDSGNSENN